MKKIWNTLKKRWGITSNFQVGIILLVFTLTGFSTIYVNFLIDTLIGVNSSSPFWQRAVVFLLIVLPVYNLLLLIWGTLFGQHKFFSRFISAFIKRIFFIKNNKLEK